MSIYAYTNAENRNQTWWSLSPTSSDGFLLDTTDHSVAAEKIPADGICSGVWFRLNTRAELNQLRAGLLGVRNLNNIPVSNLYLAIRTLAEKD